jgi:hypothetical protein
MYGDVELREFRSNVKTSIVKCTGSVTWDSIVHAAIICTSSSSVEKFAEPFLIFCTGARKLLEGCLRSRSRFPEMLPVNYPEVFLGIGRWKSPPRDGLIIIYFWWILRRLEMRVSRVFPIGNAYSGLSKVCYLFVEFVCAAIRLSTPDQEFGTCPTKLRAGLVCLSCCPRGSQPPLKKRVGKSRAHPPTPGMS